MLSCSPEPLVSFSIVIKVWGSIKTALSLSCQEENLTLPHPVKDSSLMCWNLGLDIV